MIEPAHSEEAVRKEIRKLELQKTIVTHILKYLDPTYYYNNSLLRICCRGCSYTTIVDKKKDHSQKSV